MPMIPLALPRTLAAITAIGLLAACGNDPSDDVVRTGPQAVHPSPSALAQGTPVAAVPATVTSPTVAKAVFPGVTTDASLTGPIRAFASTCLTHSPKIAALAKAASGAGFRDVTRKGNTVYASNFGGKTPGSFQVNVASSYAHECAVTTIVDQKNKTNVRETFFKSIGVPHRNGVGQVTVQGQTFTVKHQKFGGGALGLNEHAFLLQK